MPLIEIDNQLTEVFSSFEEALRNLQFEHICYLNEIKNFSDHSYPGIYMIEIHRGNFQTFDDWYAWFHPLWTDDRYVRNFVPNPKRKRVQRHQGTELNTEWIPIYLGKSRNIYKRVLEHISLSLTQPTTSLKLNARENMHSQLFRLSTIRIEVDNYDVIMPKVESALRERHNPILGRQ